MNELVTVLFIKCCLEGFPKILECTERHCISYYLSIVHYNQSYNESTKKCREFLPSRQYARSDKMISLCNTLCFKFIGINFKYFMLIYVATLIS